MMGSILSVSGVLVFFVSRAVKRAAAFEASEAVDIPG